jgi:dephospho-CoA kinase
MLKIGLTGGLGSGKTTVAHIFEVLGIPVYYADAASKRLMNNDAKIKVAVKKVFGDSVYNNEILNTKTLAEIVFNDEKKLELLNAIVHPATINDAAKWMQLQNASYAIKEAALIFESNSQTALDFVIGVKAPEKLRIERAMQRDNTSKESVLARMKKQMNEEKKLKLCDYIIENDEKQMLIPQVIALHEKLLLHSKSKLL